MSDGCWVQFWDQVSFAGPTLRMDAEGPMLAVEDMDVYTQSDGDKEGDEPDSLRTGSRAWLVIYEKKNFEGRQARFGPNSQIADLHYVNEMRGEASSFRLYDYKPVDFVSSVNGAPAAIESADSHVGAQTVNALLRTAVGAAIDCIPVVGGVINSLVSALWPDNAHEDQVWASAQNYLNQVVAGAHWQSTYDELNADLRSLYDAARAYVEAIDDDYRTSRFFNLYDEVNNLEPHFIDDDTPERRYSFMAPYVTLRLVVLLEHLVHYDYYHPGSDKSDEQTMALAKELDEAIDHYVRLLDTAKTRIVRMRREQIRTDRIQGEYAVVDDYNGYHLGAPHDDQQRALNFHADTVQYQLELKLDVHNAIGQLWQLLRPGKVGSGQGTPVPAPVLRYRTGPYGAYDADARFVDGGNGELRQLTLRSGAYVDALQLGFTNTEGAQCGGDGGSAQTLELEAGEAVQGVSGSTQGMITERGAQVPVYSPVPTKPVYENDYPFYPYYQADFIHSIAFRTSHGRTLSGGTIATCAFAHEPLPGTFDTRLIGMLGYHCVASEYRLDLVSALICQWECRLGLQTDGEAE